MLRQVHFIPHCLAKLRLVFHSSMKSFTGIMQMQGMTHCAMNLDP